MKTFSLIAFDFPFVRMILKNMETLKKLFAGFGKLGKKEIPQEIKIELPKKTLPDAIFPRTIFIGKEETVKENRFEIFVGESSCRDYAIFIKVSDGRNIDERRLKLLSVGEAWYPFHIKALLETKGKIKDDTTDRDEFFVLDSELKKMLAECFDESYITETKTPQELIEKNNQLVAWCANKIATDEKLCSQQHSQQFA